ncbi:MAG TPA: hypothetical protein PKL59_17340, partial [Nitrospira sp.]|nr:hypothetical protein [Nitrospira sp.]HNM19736.1 hypothetical protein [Nitrospira sp.]
FQFLSQLLYLSFLLFHLAFCDVLQIVVQWWRVWRRVRPQESAREQPVSMGRSQCGICQLVTVEHEPGALLHQQRVERRCQCGVPIPA